MKRASLLSLLVLTPLLAQDSRLLDYAVLLDQAPVAAKFRASERTGLAALSARAQVRAGQASLKSALSAKKIAITGSADTLVNAVFVRATREQAQELRGLPGVLNVSLTTPLKRKMDRAIEIQNVRQAWNAVGGVAQAGAGVKIAVIDSGIDQTHPALTDPAMRAPAGFPVGDAAYTTGKVIAARSYISLLTSSDPKLSSPDDFSPRDRVGHGTSMAAIAAGVSVQAPLTAISGIAPKAWLGNYKIFGTPGIHDFASTAVFVQALEDAYLDGMDVAVVSVGTQPLTGALYGALDTVAACAQTQLRSYIPANACDFNAYAVEHAVEAGMLVVVAAGNDGCLGLSCPTLGTINSPGTAPSALTVGSTTNAHQLFSKIRVNGVEYKGLFGNGPKFTSPLTAQAIDVSTVVSDATMCSGAPANSLAGKIALLSTGTCAFFQKAIAAQQAGAIAVLMYDTAEDSILPPAYLLNETGIPMAYVGVTAGNAIRAAVKGNTSLPLTIDPSLTSTDVGADVIAFDSSRGPAIGTNGIKPEIAAVGSGVYTATQRYDPNGDLFSTDGYAAVDGTSFAAAMVGGAAALVKQAHPGFSPAQLKSALVTTAQTGVISDPTLGGLARVSAVGAGRLNAGAAVAATVTANPSVIGFGVLGTTLPGAITVTLTNAGAAAANLALAVAPRDNGGNSSVTVSPSSVTLNPGQSQTFTVSLAGGVPAAGSYDGQINITGGDTNLHLPYNYIVSDKVPANSFSLLGETYFAAATEYPVYVGFRTTDRFGAPIVGAPVGWQPTNLIDFRATDTTTDSYGVAVATVGESGTPNIYRIDGYLSSTVYSSFYHFVNFVPSISKGIFNAATQLTGSLAPGSYASISGTDFAAIPIIPTTGYLPISLAEVSVTFDAPGISVVAPMSYVSSNFINVQIPWELSGQNTATVKVRYRDLPGPTVTVPLAAFSPAYFEYTDSTNNALSVAAQDAKYGLITSQNGAKRGQPAVLYANGLGRVNDTPGTGQRSGSTVISRTTTAPEVTVGGRPAQILFSGMTPETIGLYQINIVVPNDAPVGLQPLTLSIGGEVAKTSQLFVQ